ncbi:unnamed protein product [Fraxinus pennsylvanica]|uniref:Uncharacterized protein n=1 Tax=Fraxinus pennsylvanica TaxID=56036 RepID=A0AAD2AF36_9LAMI|nr:unnamed protein product [Fraxinus pennsylvanica]
MNPNPPFYVAKSVGINIDVIDLLGIEIGGSENKAKYFVAFVKQKFGQVGAILACNACEQGDFVGSSSLEGDQVLDSSCSLSVVSDTSSICGDELLGFEINSETGIPNFVDIDPIAKTRDLGEPIVNGIVVDSLSLAVDEGKNIVDGANSKSSTVVVQLEKGLSGRASHSIFEVDYVPLWGLTSICGQRRKRR